MSKKSKNDRWKIVGKSLLFLVKTPYYIGKGIYYAGKGVYRAGKYVGKKNKERKINQKRESIVPCYEEFKIIKPEIGTYFDWEKSIHDSDSKIGIILGARGSGKSAFGIKFLENLRAKKNKKCYAMGFKADEMPNWIKTIENIKELENNTFVLIDEGGILFSSRNAMSNANKLLTELILIARHKNLSILFITQNSSNLDVNILRQADFLVLKPSSLLQKDFERKIIQKIYEKINENFEELKEIKGLTYIYSSGFSGFISNPLPSFWGTRLSKSFG
ncbi:MAG TPA: zonular occludens toxin domain-containing protein [Candidatus Nanoarchaeia archaeon]|nr:zonular occludens toxin domain-containing protein [Candidatus Nanoarchaeia archaeon]